MSEYTFIVPNIWHAGAIYIRELISYMKKGADNYERRVTLMAKKSKSYTCSNLRDRIKSEWGIYLHAFLFILIADSIGQIKIPVWKGTFIIFPIFFSLDQQSAESIRQVRMALYHHCPMSALEVYIAENRNGARNHVCSA